MRLVAKFSDRILGVVAPKATASAFRCIYLNTICYGQPDGSWYCCKHYDNCPKSCYWD